MATFIQVENPKATFNEIKELIELHYNTLGGKSGFDISSDGFAVKYPDIYRLYLRIAAHSKEFGVTLGR